jgi:hypothetical protein
VKTHTNRILLKIAFQLIAAALIGAGLTILLSPKTAKSETTIEPPCDNPGWFPAEYGLKDHSVFWYDGYYYLVSINLPEEIDFAYARSADLCDWEDLKPIMGGRAPGAWDEFNIWAPFVFEDNGIYYMYYTGVTYDYTQSIMLATSSNPADPTSWQSVGMVFQPEHDGMVWETGDWANCRDATIIKIADHYYMYYTGRDITGGIIGIATAPSPYGPWQDWGAILTLDEQPSAMAESPTLAKYESLYYLFYNDTQNGQRYRIGATLAGPWSQAYVLTPGWAHEIWLDQERSTFTSYLTNYTVTIAPINWDAAFDPPLVYIGENHYRVYLPGLMR